MKQIRTVKDIEQMGTILSVWAHPDDETFSCAGIMMAALANGQQVACLTATKGEAGVQDETRWPYERLAKIRAHEMQAAMDCIGCANHHWLGYPDGGCKDVDSTQAADKIFEFIQSVQPNTILTFGPDGLTGHDDHRTVSHWVDAAVNRASQLIDVYHVVETAQTYELLKQADAEFDIFFNIDEPPLVDEDKADILFRPSHDMLERKYQALQAMPSQYEALLKRFDKAFICQMLGTEAFVSAS